MSAQPSGPAAPERLSVGEKVLYGFGQVAQTAGFDTAISFVFFYYTAVLGLSGGLVGAALAVGLAFDALVDPLVGSWSDGLTSRLGRRLPLMIAAIAPATLCMGLLFSPPRGLPAPGLFAWLAILSVGVRSFISVFNVPYIALGAELSLDYGERTRIVVYRSITGLAAGALTIGLGYSVFFAGGGLQRPDGYPAFGWTVAGVMFAGMSICCVGLLRRAPRLPQPQVTTPALWRRLPKELGEIFANRSFRLLFISALVTFVAQGVNATLNSHAFVFVWRLKSDDIQFITYAFLVGLLLGMGGAPAAQRRLEKKQVVLVGLALLIGNWLVIQGLWLVGAYRPLGLAALGPMQLNSFVAGIGLGLVSVAYPSMMADAADEHEQLFQARREGLYFAGLGFANKAATGLGVLLAGVALDAVGFPRGVGAHTGLNLPVDVQARLVAVWGPLAALVAILSMLIFAGYGITRARHREIVEALTHRRALAAEGAATIAGRPGEAA